MKSKILETDLYMPIRRFFTAKGYEVYGEVNHCDIVAVKDEELIIIELKLNLNVELLVQAAKRQRLTDLVYIAVPKPRYSLSSKKWQDICHLVRRLELGLIVVSFQKGNAVMNIMVSPAPFDRQKSLSRHKKKRNNILVEINGRNGDYNVGGSSKTKILTAYKENCIQIACLLERFGCLSPKSLREMGTDKKTLSILNKNFYGWFVRVRRGSYDISETGKKELLLYPQLVDYYTQLTTDSSN